jgi:lysophospholipase L1-like esterase
MRGKLQIYPMIYLAALALMAGRGEAQKPVHWVGTWAASPVPIDNSKGPLGTADYTIREIVHTSLPGKKVRVVLSNEMGSEPLTIGAAQLAFSAGEGKVVISSATDLSFNGRKSVTIPQGAKVFSDGLAMDLPFGSNLAVSLFIPKQSITQLTQHAYGNQSNYFAHGNQIAAESLDKAAEVDPWHFLTGVEVEASADSAAVVTLGDSITDGAFSTRSANLRWPDDLARRLHGNPKTANLAVLNAGIGGNRILHDQIGPNAGTAALARFDRDVLSLAGTKYLLILEGINDIGLATRPKDPVDPVSAEDVIFGLSQMIDRAHTHGLKVYLATIMPDEGLDFYYSEAGESERQAVNSWIRGNKLADGIIDFDTVMRDPQNPKRLLPAYDRDHIHPNDAGHKAMADAIDLAIFSPLN